MKPRLYRDGQHARIELSDPEAGQAVDAVLDLEEAERLAHDLEQKAANHKPVQVLLPPNDIGPIRFELSAADAAGLAGALLALVGEIRVGVN